MIYSKFLYNKNYTKNQTGGNFMSDYAHFIIPVIITVVSVFFIWGLKIALSVGTLGDIKGGAEGLLTGIFNLEDKRLQGNHRMISR